MIGSFGAVWWEKSQLEKKWSYYDKYYPEATQLQRTLVQEASIIKDRNIQEIAAENKRELDPEEEKIYSQFYQLPPQKFAESE